MLALLEPPNRTGRVLKGMLCTAPQAHDASFRLDASDLDGTSGPPIFAIIGRDIRPSDVAVLHH